MLKISTEIDFENKEREGEMVKCPVCGQKLYEVRNMEGYAMTRIQCRRCKHFIDIYIVGKGHKGA